ncbi:condensation domain-containing protein, partial [Streptomyces sp. NL15-2K]
MSTQSSRESRISSLPEHMQELLRQRLTGRAPKNTGIPRASREGDIPASFAQQRLWFIDEFQPGGVEYNTGLALRITGPLDADALRQAVADVVRRHESLRTTFGEVDGRAIQIVHDSMEVPVVHVDLSSATETVGEDDVVDGHTAAPARTADELLRERLLEPFDLRTGPLFRVLLARLGPQEHILLLSMHHIVSDGWSLGVLTREVGAAYTAALNGERAELPLLPVQYADYAVWQRERVRDGAQDDEQLEFWRNKLAGVEVLELPTDRPRPAVRSSAGALHRFEVPHDVVSALRELGRARDASLFVELTALTQMLLAYYSGQDDIALGTVTSGRERPELEGLIGFFVNTLVLRGRVDRSLGFDEFLASVRATVLEAFDHRDVPFDRVVEAVAPERDPSRMPLVQAVLVLQNAPAPEIVLPGARVEPVDVTRDALPFDLTFEFSEQGEGLVGAIEYNTDLFDAATAERMAAHWLNLAREAVTAPSQRLADISALGEGERALVVDEWSGVVGTASGRSVVEVFAERV